MQFSLTRFVVGWEWYVRLLQEDERHLQLLPALDAKYPPRFWEGSAIIPMELAAMRGFADEHPEIPNPLNEDLVPLAQTDGTEWRPLLEWSGAGGFDKAIAGPPSNNAWMIRVVSPTLKAAIERFCLPPHRFYPVGVRHEFTGEVREYFMFHLLGDFLTERVEAYWPAIKFQVFEEKPRRVIKTYPPGSASNHDEYVDIYRSYGGTYDLNTINYDYHYLIYREPYDLVWGNGGMAMSSEMGSALEAEFGDEVVGNWIASRKPIITGFDPERDELPEDLLVL